MPQKVSDFSPDSLFLSLLEAIPRGECLAAICSVEEDKGLIVSSR